MYKAKLAKSERLADPASLNVRADTVASLFVTSNSKS
jgi:hypothetical protein